MAKIDCAVHGAVVAALVCAHIQDAIREAKPLLSCRIEEEVAEGWTWPFHLCQDCAKEVRPIEREAVSELDDEQLSRLEPVCGECFGRWLDSHHPDPQ